MAPRHALIPVGRRNAYGHPASEVLTRYRQVGAQVWHMDHSGALDLRIDPAGIRNDEARRIRKRYWHGRGNSDTDSSRQGGS